MMRKSLRGFLIPFTLLAQSNEARVQESPRVFVKTFYDWYVPIANQDHKGPSSDAAIKQKSSMFSLELANALREDSAAQAKAQGEIVGLDSDPFLSTQDPESRYKVGKVIHKGDRWFVEVHGVRNGKPHLTPDVIAELQPRGKSWVFVNFQTPGKPDLLSVLTKLRLSRQKEVKP